MSYDLRLAVKVYGAEDLYAGIDEPERSSPTYNIGDMLRACTGWDFVKSEWYKVSDVLPLIEHGIHELRFNEKEYKKYNAPNGWGPTRSALAALESLLECIMRNGPGAGWAWHEIPLDCMYVAW